MEKSLVDSCSFFESKNKKILDFEIILPKIWKVSKRRPCIKSKFYINFQTKCLPFSFETKEASCESSENKTTNNYYQN